jgi:hypothetical protein
MPFPRAAKRQLELPTVSRIIPVERPSAWNVRLAIRSPSTASGASSTSPHACTIRSKRGHTFKRFNPLVPSCGR